MTFTNLSKSVFHTGPWGGLQRATNQTLTRVLTDISLADLEKILRKHPNRHDIRLQIAEIRAYKKKQKIQKLTAKKRK